MNKLITSVLALIATAFIFSCTETPTPAVPTAAAPAADMVTVTFMLRDGKDDTFGPTVWFYDNSSNNAMISGPHFLKYYNQFQEVQLRCVRGHKICLGARHINYNVTRTWGCGYGCVKYCANCCRTCTEATYPITLN